MRRVVLLLLVPLAGVVLFALLPQPEPPEYVSKEHKFRVRFRGEPKVSPREDEVPRTDYVVDGPDGSRSVIVRDMPAPDDDPPGRTELYLASARDELVRSAGAELTADATTTLAGKYPGRAFAARFRHPRPGVMRVHIYFVGKRLYQVTVKGTEEFANSMDATAFLDSFALTE